MRGFRTGAMSALVLLAVLTSAAAAQARVCGTGSNPFSWKYLNANDCLDNINRMSGMYELLSRWESSGVVITTSVGDHAETTTSLVLEDLGATTAVECTHVLSEGTVGAGGTGEVTAVTFLEPTVNCLPAAKAINLKGESVTNACVSVKTVAAVDLPWKTELAATGEIEFLNVFEPTSKGEPGYLVECKNTLGVTTDDTCTTTKEHEDTAVLTNSGGGGVSSELLSSMEEPSLPESCSIGGTESGLVIGGDALMLLSEGTLTVVNTE